MTPEELALRQREYEETSNQEALDNALEQLEQKWSYKFPSRRVTIVMTDSSAEQITFVQERFRESGWSVASGYNNVRTQFNVWHEQPSDAKDGGHVVEVALAEGNIFDER